MLASQMPSPEESAERPNRPYLVAPRKSVLHGKIRNVCNAVGNMSKDSQGPGYKFTSYDTTMQTLRPVLSDQKLRIKFSEVSCVVDPSLKTASGKPAVGALLKMALYIIDLESGEFDVVEASGYSLDVGDKAVAQAITIAKKYCLFDAFEISTSGGSNPGAAGASGDDPDGRPDKNVRDDTAHLPAEQQPAPAGLIVQIRRRLASLVAQGVTGATEAAVLERHAKGKTSLEQTNVAQARAIDNALAKYTRTTAPARTGPPAPITGGGTGKPPEPMKSAIRKLFADLQIVEADFVARESSGKKKSVDDLTFEEANKLLQYLQRKRADRVEPAKP